MNILGGTAGRPMTGSARVNRFGGQSAPAGGASVSV
jgi:hypothetical protein